MHRIGVIAAFILMSVCALASGTRELAFEPLLTGAGSRIEHTAIYYVRSEREWQELWAAQRVESGGAGAPPPVDFKKHFVIGFYAGLRGSAGYKVSIRRIVEQPDKISLEIEEIYPGADCLVPTMITSPFQLVKIARRDGNPVFDFSIRRILRAC